MFSVSSSEQRRLLSIALILALFFSLLIARFYQIQITEGEKWTRLALAQHQTVLTESATRGTFYASALVNPAVTQKSQVLVKDIPKFHMFVDCESIPLASKERFVKELSQLLHLDPRQETKLRSDLLRKSRCRKLCSWLEHRQVEMIKQWWKRFAMQRKITHNSLFFSLDYQRVYPCNSMLSYLLHTLQGEKDPVTGERIPTGGLEASFNSYLKGSPGKRLITHTPRHTLGHGTLLEIPQNGADIHLTIDYYLQAIVEAELEKGIRNARARGGWAILMDPYTGAILALGQSPSFPTAQYAQNFEDPIKREWMRPKALTDNFEPGSIMKPITVAVCLQANEELRTSNRKVLFSPQEKIAVADGKFPGRTTPIRDGRGHRFLNMDLALQKSSNIYVARLAQRLIDTLGEHWYRNALEKIFGLGQKSLLDAAGENAYRLPIPGKCHPNGTLEWSVPTPYSLAMGHNLVVNSLQMARAYAVFANGGFLVQPHLIQKIAQQKPDGKEEILLDRTGKNTPIPQRVLSAANAKIIARSLKFVTKEGGTSRRADISGYTEAGKSGTSEKIVQGAYSKSHHYSSFVGFAPADSPRFVLIVVLDDPEIGYVPGFGRNQLGGVCAAPIFREIARQSLQYLGVDPDDPYGYPPGDPRHNAQKADWGAEVQALKQLYSQWNL